MELNDFKNAIRTLDQEQLAQAFDFADQNYELVAPELITIIKDAAAQEQPLDDAEQRKAIEAAFMILAFHKQTDIFPTIYRFARKPKLNENIPEDDWFLRELHRLFGIFAEPDDIGAIGDLVLDASLCTPVREQALLTFHFLWVEKRVQEKDIIDEYRRLLEQGLDSNDDWKLWMALIINAAVVGGNKLKPQVMSILDSGKVGDQTSFVKKVVNGLFSNGNARFRNMLRSEHKGFYEDVTAEINDYCTPPMEKEIEMPEKGRPMVREEPKIGRNDSCPCGSGKKYKKCCGKDK